MAAGGKKRDPGYDVLESLAIFTPGVPWKIGNAPNELTVSKISGQNVKVPPDSSSSPQEK